MKTSLLIIVAFIITNFEAKAQHANVGIKAGINAYTTSGDNTGDNEYKIGFNVGLLSHFHMGGQFAMQPELYFSQQGTSNKNNGNAVDLNLNYVNIPVLFQYMFDNGFRIEAGPQLGILASAKTKIGSNNLDVKNNFNSTDIGLTVGMSYVKPSTGFGYDIRYNLGLTNINEGNTDVNYNRGFQFGLFYLIQHKS